MIFLPKVSVRLYRPNVGRGCQASSGLSVVPWHQLVEARDRVVREAADGVGEPGLRINAVQRGGFYQRKCVCGGYRRAF